MRSRHPVLTYTTARLTVFVVFVGVLYLLGARSWPLLLTALVFSAIASFFLLNGQRDAMSAALASRREAMRQRMAERERAEDAWDDEQRSRTETGEAGPGGSAGPAG